MSDIIELPNKIRIANIYEAYRPVFTECLEKIENKLKSVVHLSSKPSYKARIKSFDSYYKKILRQKSDEAAYSSVLVPLTDMMGIRIICAFLEDIENVVMQLTRNFSVQEVEHKGVGQSFKEFGYESVHVLISIPADCLPEEHTSPGLPSDVLCEIQVRTILQDAWAEVEHELIYKSEFNPFDKPLRRKLAAINANLGLADTIFQEIRDYQNKLQAELNYRRNTFYDEVDRLSEDDEHAEEEREVAFNVDYANETGSIDDLVLAALHEHNCGHFAKAISIYTRIIETTPPLPDVMLSVILKHRGMAYFAQNKYDESLSDFQESERFDSRAFRSCYYEGIVYSIKKDEHKAIECFNKSLQIDKYQSHVYYRRALAYFNLSMYTEAMDDINSAMELGLNNDDAKKLKEKLLKKFDMKV